MQKTFTSSISGKTFPLAEKVTGRSIRDCILKEINKDHPGFDASGAAAVSEVNTYRNKYMQSVLQKESGMLGNIEQTVLDNLALDKTLSDKLMQEEQVSHFTFGQRVADRIATFGGSWTFILSFLFILISWIILNSLVLIRKPFDPYPFILLNLVLSCIAALQAPIIMMSQNRQEEKDRSRARNDYMINLKSEMEIRMLHEKIDHLIINQQETLLEIQQVQIDMMNEIMDRLEHKKTHEKN